MSYELKEKVVWFALGSRILTVGLSSLSNVLLPDHEPAVFKTPLTKESSTNIDNLIEFLLGGLTRWDAQYFLHVSYHGYTYENTLAFFPLYPFFIRILSSIVYFFANQFISYYSSLILSAFLINLFCFIKSATILYKLTLIVFKSKELAYKASIFYCMNPGSIFFTAFYSESCFAYFTFSGMLLLQDKKLWPAACLCLGLSCAARSNGILNLGFIAHLSIKHCLNSKIDQIIPFSLMSLISVGPFLIFQFYSYSKYCVTSQEIFSDPIKEYGRINGYVFPGDSLSPWCNSSFPLSYSYVQDHYWNVGFLRYFQWKQLPNFVLALPIIIIVLSNSFVIFKENIIFVFTLGFTNKSKMKCKGYIAEPVLFVFIAHAVILTIFCTFCIHVQVTTRMVASSSPVFYWLLAVFYSSKKKSEKPHDILQRKFIINSCNGISQKEVFECSENMQSRWKVFFITEKANNMESQFIKTYLVLYFVLGNILFSNYYPWT